MRLGLIARMDNSGLGIQTYNFYKHMKPDKTLVVDISALERDPKRVMKQYPDRYPNATFIYGFPNTADIYEFLKDLDVVFVAESPYNYDLYRIAKELGVKMACQYNYEFFDWFKYPGFPKPDLLIAPSVWHYDRVDEWARERGVQHTYLHCPVDRSDIPMRMIMKANKFVHIAGRPAAHDRNGTMTFLEASQIDTIQHTARFIVYCQDEELGQVIKHNFPRVELKMHEPDYHQMYAKGDVLVLPRRYGGNCLPLNEALSAGMPVIMTDVEPNNQFLPHEWLVHAEKVAEFEPRTTIDIYEAKPHELLLKMMWFASLSEVDMLYHNGKANELADSISWETLRPKYVQVLSDLAEGKSS